MIKTLLLLFLLCSFQFSSLAQEFPFALTTFEDTYVPLSEALLVTPADDEDWDDPELGFYTIPIGFTFDLMGRSSDVLALIDPGVQLVIGINEDTVNVLSPYFADVHNADTNDVVSSIVYSTEGLEGNRIFKLEWQNVGFYNEFAATGEFMSRSNFQVWFYETSNDIEFRFGPNSIDDGTLIHDQWPAPLAFFIRDFVIETQLPTDTWGLMGPAENPIAGPINLYQNPDFEELLVGEPFDGIVYHFDAPTVGINENDHSPSFSVFPTVATEQVMIYYGGFSKVNLRIHDAYGSLVEDMNMQHGNQEIDISGWPSGMYFFTVGVGADMQTSRIIKR